jgi:phosphatidylglycerol lysyltransferase
LPASLARTERLLKKYGGSSDDYFKIWPQDKSYYFSKNKEAAICYGVKSGSAICIGDLAGDKALSQELIIKFNQFCQKNDWDPCFVYIENKIFE